MRKNSLVEDMMAEIKKKEGIPSCQQRLSFGGKHLEEHYVIKDYVLKNCTIHLSLRIQGEGQGESEKNPIWYDHIKELFDQPLYSKVEKTILVEIIRGKKSEIKYIKGLIDQGGDVDEGKNKVFKAPDFFLGGVLNIPRNFIAYELSVAPHEKICKALSNQLDLLTDRDNTTIPAPEKTLESTHNALLVCYIKDFVSLSNKSNPSLVSHDLAAFWSSVANNLGFILAVENHQPVTSLDTKVSGHNIRKDSFSSDLLLAFSKTGLFPYSAISNKYGPTTFVAHMKNQPYVIRVPAIEDTEKLRSLEKQSWAVPLQYSAEVIERRVRQKPQGIF
eukprot:278076-Ditylum_brightwellii.AAC.1